MFTPSNTRSFAIAQDDTLLCCGVYTERSERVPQDDKEKVNMMIRNGKQNHVTGVILNEVKNLILKFEGVKVPPRCSPKNKKDTQGSLEGVAVYDYFVIPNESKEPPFTVFFSISCA